MLGDVEVLGPRSYDVKEAYIAVADTIDRFLSDIAMSPRMERRAGAQGIQFPAAEDSGSCGLSRVRPSQRSFDHDDALIHRCIVDIQERAYRDHANVKVAHFFAKRGVTFGSIKEVIKGEVLELLDLPSFEDFGPLFTLNIKSNLAMSMSFNGKKWSDTASEQTDLKAKGEAYQEAKSEQGEEAVGGAVEGVAEEQEAPEEVAGAIEDAEGAQDQASAARDAVLNPEIPTTIEEWEETIDSILGETEEEEEEASNDEIEAQLRKLMGMMGEELSKVKKHAGRARFFRDRLPSETELDVGKGFTNCAHAWDVVYEFYNFLHHVDKARYYLASLVVFLQQSTGIAEEWIKEWEKDRLWDVGDACDFFEDGTHLACRKVCYGDKARVDQEFAEAKSAGTIKLSRLERLRGPGGGYLPVSGGEAEEEAGSASRSRGYERIGGTDPKNPLTKWKTKSLAFSDSAGKDAEKKGFSCLDAAQKLFEVEYELNQTQQALYDMSQNELVQDALEARKLKEEASLAKSKLKRWWKKRKQKGLDPDSESDLAPLLSAEERDAASVCMDAAIDEAKVEASPMMDRFERFVLGITKDVSIKPKDDAAASRMNNYMGAVAWNRGDDDKLFEAKDPGEMRLARMLLHVYGNIENKPLSTRAWIKFQDKAGAIDKEKLAINLAFYATSIVITVTTGGAGLPVVVAARAANKACKKTTMFALDESGKSKAAAKLSAGVGAARSSDDAADGVEDQIRLEVDSSALEEFGEKVVAHFLSAQKNMNRLKKQRDLIAGRREAFKVWEKDLKELEAAEDPFDEDEVWKLRKALREKTLSELESELKGIADELRELSGDALKERQKETKAARESLNKRIATLKESIKDFEWVKSEGFDPGDYLDLSPDFSSCDEAAAYVWAAVKFEMHYQKYAFYSTYLLSYVQATLKELCDWEIYLRKRWGNSKKPGDIGTFIREWITEQNHTKHVQETDATGPGGRCATVVMTEETSLLRGKGESGAKQAVGGRKRVIICYGPDIEDASPDAWAPRYATELEKVQDTAEKTWKDIQKTQEDLAKEWDKLKKERDSLVGKYETACGKLEAAKELLATARLVNLRTLFS